MSSIWEPRPVPNVTPETERFWEGAADERFLICTCQDCGLTYYYPRLLCPDCFGSGDWHEASGIGSVYSYSIAEQVAGWPEKALPLIIAYIQLEEGPRVLSNVVNCNPEEIEIGAPAEVTFVSTETQDIAIPVFELYDS